MEPFLPKADSYAETDAGAMKPFILFLSDLDAGGAAIACERVYRRCNADAGVRAAWLVANGNPRGAATVAAQWPDICALARYEIWRRLSGSERRIALAYARLNDATMARWVRRFNPDLVNIFNIHEGMSSRFLEMVPRRIPIVWTMQDMWPITGYCAYSLRCEKYATGCEGECEQSSHWGEALRPPVEEWRIRQRFFESNGDRVTLVSPSRWLAECTRKRLKDLVRIEVIPNPVDMEIFKPIAPRVAVRNALNLPADGLVLLIAAHSLKYEVKGMRYTLESLRLLRDRYGSRLTVAAFGNAPPGDVPDFVRHVGVICDERLLNLYFNAADVFLQTSLAESFGLVYAEALAAGTPCVAFAAAACPEIVRDGISGYAVPLGDAESIADRVSQLLDMEESARQAMRAECRRIADAEYNTTIVCAKYRALYDNVLKNPPYRRGRM